MQLFPKNFSASAFFRCWWPHDGCAIIAETGYLVRRGGLSDNFEEAIIFSRRARQEQTFERGTDWHILPPLFLRRLVLLPEARYIRDDGVLCALASDPIAPALAFRWPGEDRAFERQFKGCSRPLQEHHHPLTGFDDLVLLNYAVAHNVAP